MESRISFDINDAKLIEEKPNSSFSILSLDFFASGPNKNKTYVSEETLDRTAGTIKNIPLVWKYDPRLDDAYTHDDEEVPCGFVPENTRIESRKLADGRTMLSVIAYVWKRYSGRILDFFKRDGDKPVSVEISVFETSPRQDGLTEIMDYRYEAVTVLGSFVQPAIPLAKATVLQFSDEYKQAFEMEFGDYNGIDFTIPDKVKKNVQFGIDHLQGMSSVSLSNAKYLIKNDKVSPQRLKQIYRSLFSRRNKDVSQSEPPTEGYISWMLMGGTEGFGWSKKIVDEMNDIDQKKIDYFSEMTFPYKNIGDVNPALKGIKPPISVSQANEIARQADAIGTDEDKNGWAIAISNFKKTHKVVDGKWVKKEETSKMTDEEKDKEQEMAQEQTFEEEDKETPEQEDKETPEEDKQEGEYSLDAYLDVKAMLAFLEKETETFKEVSEEFAKPYAEMNYGRAMGAMYGNMYARMCKMEEMCNTMAREKEEMSLKMAEAEEKARTYMAENEELKKFKAEKEQQEFNFAVDFTLKEIEEKVEIPEEQLQILKEESKKYNFENIDTWKNLARSKALDFAAKKSDAGETQYKKYVWDTGSTGKINNSPWSR